MSDQQLEDKRNLVAVLANGLGARAGTSKSPAEDEATSEQDEEEAAAAANKTVIHRDNNNEATPAANASAGSTNSTTNSTTTATTLSQLIDLDVECERLLRNAKKQVKQMMEEAVTKKFIHEESSSMMALCVSIDACLSHGLKRRALGLFKTNSSTALVQKIAKSCPDARAIISMVETESKRQEGELRLARRQSQAEPPTPPATLAAQGGRACCTGAANLHHQHQHQHHQWAGSRAGGPAVVRLASNSSLHRRHLWIKCALVERKLVAIVEHLARNASNYYEPSALMANCLTSQLLCSLLVGPCALEFSRSKTAADQYQFEEPSAAELLRRHKLSNPIACLCAAPAGGRQLELRSSLAARRPSCRHRSASRRVNSGLCQSASLNQRDSSRQQRSPGSQAWTRTQTDDASRCCSPAAERRRHRRATTGETSPGAAGHVSNSASEDTAGRELELSPSDNEENSGGGGANVEPLALRPSSRSPSNLVRKDSRRRPLALKTNARTGALVTECHHYCCQDLGERHQTRGYSFKSATTSGGGGGGGGPASQQPANSNSPSGMGAPSPLGATTNPCGSTTPSLQQQDEWSPRMLHETLHQNAKSSLLYAKNNVLLETQAHGTMAGYLSLHQTSSDLILKWIPNQLINGGHQAQQAPGGAQPDGPKQQSCPAAGREGEQAALQGRADRAQGDACGQRAHSLDNLRKQRRRRMSECLTFATKVGSDCATAAGAGTLAARRLSSNNSRQECASLAKSRATVDGSYLELVVSLSVSRIVLLHCHFGASLMATADWESGSSFNNNNDDDDDDDDDDDEHADKPMDDGQGPQSTAGPRPPPSGEQETLILVEADGVQRAPFTFPKGGLRWFLSCLENGLRPDKYLESALKLDGSSLSFEGDQAGRGQPVDPLQSTQSISDEAPPLFVGPEAATAAAARVDSPTSDHLSSPPAGATISRFDVLLRRLPSLRRRPLAKSSGETSANDTTAGNSSQTSSRIASPIPASAASEQQARAMPYNYVYRIVSTNHCEWRQATPPLSALSVASSSSGSFALMGKSLMRQVRPQQQQPAETGNDGQRFRWSLSRLARFSSRGGGSGSGPTSLSPFGAAGPDGLRDSSTTSNQQTTIDSFGSSLSDSLAHQQQQQQANGVGMKRDSSSELVRIETKLNDLKKTSSDELMALRDHSILTLCEQMRKQILARAFYGWLAHCRRMKIIRNHLIQLVKLDELELLLEGHDHQFEGNELLKLREGLTRGKWTELMSSSSADCEQRREMELVRKVNRLVYFGGVEDNELRAEVWPYLLGHYQLGDSPETRKAKDQSSKLAYESAWRDWIKIERVVKRRDREILAANMAKVARLKDRPAVCSMSETSGELPATVGPLLGGSESGEPECEDDFESGDDCQEEEEDEEEEEEGDENLVSSSYDSRRELERNSNPAEGNKWPAATSENSKEAPAASGHNANNNNNNDQPAGPGKTNGSKLREQLKDRRKQRRRRRFRLESTGSVGSDASITDQFGNNIHRIDKDVQRCDRNFWYFKDTSNLEKLRNIMCSYVWKHLDVGYVQGMCDLAAPFLVIFDDELMAFNCFSKLMERMVANFPHGSAMDQHFESLKYLMQVLDPKLFEVLQNNGDYTHFYFCYRWLLLDFKRELAYEDVYRVWETIWSARRVASDHFVVFLALAMVRYYRDIIIENNMDFTDTIKFFNEMAERHDINRIIILAQDLMVELESLIR